MRDYKVEIITFLNVQPVFCLHLFFLADCPHELHLLIRFLIYVQSCLVYSYFYSQHIRERISIFQCLDTKESVLFMCNDVLTLPSLEQFEYA